MLFRAAFMEESPSPANLQTVSSLNNSSVERVLPKDERILAWVTLRLDEPAIHASG